MEKLKTKFIIEFRFGYEISPYRQEIEAFTREEAAILAKAERIKKGLDFHVENVWTKPL